MIDRRQFVTSLLAPALQPARSRSLGLGPHPRHTEAQFRTALDDYLTAYARFFDASEPWPLDDDTALDHAGERWSRAKDRLLAMIHESHGRSETTGVGIAALEIDLGDALLIAAERYDETADTDCESSLVIVPRSPAMRRRLQAVNACTLH